MSESDCYGFLRKILFYSEWVALFFLIIHSELRVSCYSVIVVWTLYLIYWYCFSFSPFAYCYFYLWNLGSYKFSTLCPSGGPPVCLFSVCFTFHMLGLSIAYHIFLIFWMELSVNKHRKLMEPFFDKNSSIPKIG